MKGGVGAQVLRVTDAAAQLLKRKDVAGLLSQYPHHQGIECLNASLLTGRYTRNCQDLSSTIDPLRGERKGEMTVGGPQGERNVEGKVHAVGQQKNETHIMMTARLFQMMNIPLIITATLIRYIAGFEMILMSNTTRGQIAEGLTTMHMLGDCQIGGPLWVIQDMTVNKDITMTETQFIRRESTLLLIEIMDA